MKRLLAGLLFLILTSLWFAGLRTNPPGFYADESSIAYNALLIVRDGVDEHGVHWPLYFKAFGEYKNPVYIYLLAGVFKAFGSGNLTARIFSALLGYFATLVMAALAWRITKRWPVALATFATAILTPMLFEIARLVFEVAAFPLVIATFLYLARVAYERPHWPLWLVVALVVTLALVTFTYTSGRALAFAFAPMLLLFYRRERRAALAAVLAGFIVFSVVPVMVYAKRNPGALSQRLQATSSITMLRERPIAVLAELERNYAAHLAPIGLGLHGDFNFRHHVPNSGGSILLMTFVLAAIGFWRTRRERWSWFLLVGALVSLVPGAVTRELYHTLRIAPYPLFLIALSIPALDTLRRRLLLPILALGLLQAAVFQVQFHRTGRYRGGDFDVGIKEVTYDALAQPVRPIYASDWVYIHSWWYAALRGVDRDAFRIFPEDAPPAFPPGSVVISMRDACPKCVPISKYGNYTAYIQY